jgi:transposase
MSSGCERLMTVPGIGPIISSAMVAAIGTGEVFSKGRDFGAWLGLVPKQISTGDRTILGSISRRGNRNLRALIVQAAWVLLVKLGPKQWERYGLKSWIEAAKKRLHHNVLAIALANKLALIAWAVLHKGPHLRVRHERSEMGQQQTHAPQQMRRYSITSSAVVNNVGGNFSASDAAVF